MMRWLWTISCLAACDLSWNHRDFTQARDARSPDVDSPTADARADATHATDATIDGPVAAVDAAVPPDALTLGTLSQRAYIKSAMTAQSKQFGGGIALSSDGSRLAVSEANDVQIFSRSSMGAWSYEATIAVGVDTVGTGTILGLSGDGTRLAVGVFDHAAYVFVRSGTTWTQEARLDHPAKQTADFFGVPIAISRDGTTIVIGAYDENSTNVPNTLQTFAGAAHVFTRAGTTWSYRQRLLGSNTEPNDYFGTSVTVSADGSTIAVGAYGERSTATVINGDQGNGAVNAAGATYVFALSGSTWTQQAYVKSSQTASQQYFGWSTSLDDTGSTLAVGAYYASSGQGRTYLFTRSGTTWSQQAGLMSPNPGSTDMFGTSVALSADGNTLAIGAPGEASASSDPADNSRPYAGAAYVLTRSGAMWSHTAYVKASNPGQDDRFGNRVALSGTGTVLTASAYAEASNATGINGNQLDNSVPYAGAVYAFE